MNHRVLLFCALLFSAVFLTGANAASSNAIDRIDFGSLTSEAVHNFMPNTAVNDMALSGTGVYGQTYRYPFGSGNSTPTGSQVLIFTMACDPVRQNYMSIKLWGNDPNTEMYLLNDSAANAYIDSSYNSAPAFPNRFYYYTVTIPLSWTQGKTSAQLGLLFASYYDRYGGTGINYLTEGQFTRPIYSAFTHTAPMFVPDSADVVGSAPTITGTATLTTLTSGSAIGILQANRTSLYTASSGYIDTIIARQVTSGTSGHASSVAPPKEVVGLDLFTNQSTWTGGTSDDAWRNRVANQMPQPGYTAFPTELMSVLASAYLTKPFVGTSGTVAGLDRYHQTSLLTKAVAAMDSASFQQDSDGGFIQQGSEWTGLCSTARTTGAFIGSKARQSTVHGGGDLQGIDTYALGWAIIQLLNDPAMPASSGTASPTNFQDYLGGSYDADLNSGSMLRAYAYERMLFNAINFYAYGTGGAESQNMFQMLALYSMHVALQKLQALYPNASYVVSSSTYNSGNYLGTATPLDAAKMVMGVIPTTLRNLKFPTSGTNQINYGLTQKGLGEANGAMSSGFDGGYGQWLTTIAPRIAQLAQWDPTCSGTDRAIFNSRANAVINAYAQFLSPLPSTTAVLSGTVATAAYSFADEDFISYRNNYNPNSNAGTFNFDAQYLTSDTNGVLNNAYGIRAAYLNTQYNQLPSTASTFFGLANLRDLSAYENSLRSLIGVNPATLTPFPAEIGQPDFAWTDVQNGAVVFRNNGERFYMNANWRNTLGSVSNVARMHYTTAGIERAAQIVQPYNSANQQSDLNLSGTNYLSQSVVRYGDYLVVLNNGTTSYNATLPSGYGQAKDLVSGSNYNLGTTVTVSSSNSAIFWLAASGTMTSGTGAPTVATAAAASPATVTGTTTSLSVLGADNGGEGALTYTWSLAGSPPSPVTFSANGTNAAKNTTATFSADGTYNFVVVIKDAGGLTVSSNVTVTVAQTLASVGISPNPVTVTNGQSLQLFGAGYDQFGALMQTPQAFTWTLLSGTGTLNAVGNYTAPSGSGGTASVRLNAGALSATAAVTVMGAFTGSDDIGSPALSGSTTLTSGTYTVTAAGNDIWSASDQFHFTYIPITGDSTITARVVSMANTSVNAKAGVMFRESLDANSAFAMALATPTTTNGVEFNYRSSAGGGPNQNAKTTGVTAPYWMRLTRSGDAFTAFTSPDGTTWTQLGTAQTISAMDDTIYVGLALTSVNVSTRNTTKFDNVSITQPARTIFPYDKTIGSATPGSYLESGTTVTMTGRSSDIWSNTDSFQFAYKAILGSGTLTARVVSISGVPTTAKVGVMIRDTLAGGSREASTLISAANVIRSERRTSTNGSTTETQVSTFTPPYWLRIVRSGTNFSSYRSPDGSTWTQVGSTTGITTGTATQFGLAVASLNTSNPTTAVFDNITLTGSANTAPTIATSATAGAVSSNTVALSVLGADATGAESNLIYSWNLVGVPPGAVSYSANGTNAAKNTTAAFINPGTYYFQVTATDSGGQMVTSSIVTVTVGTIAPTSLAAAGGNGQVDLNWSAVSGATGYNVKRSTVSGTNYSTIAPSVSGTTYSDASVTNGTTYYYVVTALSAGGESVNSPQASATPRSGSAWLKFDETSGTTAADSTGHGWNGTLVNSGTWAAGKINNAVSLSGSAHVTLPTGVVASLNDFTVSTWIYLTGTSNWQRIFDFGGGAATTGTATNMYLTTKSSSSGKPRFGIKIANSAEQQIDASSALATGTWNHVAVTLSGSTGVLYLNGAASGTNSGITFDPSGMGSTTQNYIGRSQWPADPYLSGLVDDFKIVDYAMTASEIATLASALNAPTGLAAASGNNQVALTWNATAGAAGYRVKRSLTSGSNYSTIFSTGTTPAYTDATVANGTAYFYILTATNNIGESLPSAEVSATPMPPPPTAPTSLTASGSTEQISLAWNPSSGADTYNVWRSLVSGTGFALIGSGITDTGYIDTALDDETAYFYFVTATNMGGTSGNSAEATATTFTALQNWRLIHFGTISNSGTAADDSDPDGDGMTNAQEFNAGTDPNDRANILRVSKLEASEVDMLVSFPTVIGKTYSVERSDTMASGSWTTVQDNIAGIGGTVQVTDLGGSAQPKRFYRIVVVP